jgi:hypothetical protein
MEAPTLSLRCTPSAGRWTLYHGETGQSGAALVDLWRYNHERDCYGEYPRLLR